MANNDWFRIDKADGSVTRCTSVNVVRAARGSYDNVADVIQAGRFQTPFAIYSQRQHLTAEDNAAVMHGCHHCNEPTIDGHCWWCGKPFADYVAPEDRKPISASEPGMARIADDRNHP